MIDDIINAVNNGNIVIIPEKTVTINQWSGSGYMILDPDSCACGYMISGGLSGGAMTFGEVCEEYIGQVVMGFVFMQIWKQTTFALLSMTPCMWVETVELTISYTQTVMFLSIVTEMIALVGMYVKTGEVKYLQELLIQIAAIGTISLVSNLTAGKTEKFKEAIEEEIENAGLKGACFVAGTLVSTPTGLVSIEDIRVGDLVKSFNPGTLEVSDKKVIGTIEKQISELIHISINKEVVDTTTNHPFYVLDRGFVKAIDLRAGDVLCTVNGDYVTVEWIEHEILEKNIKVFNLSVEDNHTYFVGKNGVGVHNTCSITDIISKIPDKFKQHGKCNEFAEELKTRLEANNIEYEIIRVESRTGIIYSNKYKGSISTNKYHYGILVDGVIFDNMTPEGMDFSAWKTDLGLDMGLKDMSYETVKIIDNK